MSVCLYVYLQNFVDPVSQELMSKLMKLYIHLHLYVIWRSLHFGVYRSRSSDVIRIFCFFNTVEYFVDAVSQEL